MTGLDEVVVVGYTTQERPNVIGSITKVDPSQTVTIPVGGSVDLVKMKNKIIIAGGTGALGRLLTDYYRRKDWEVVILTRSPHRGSHNIRFVLWDGRMLGTWADELSGATAVVNLVGKSINTRFTANNKEEILGSRVHSTAVIGEAIGINRRPPKVWINAGGISIFESSVALKTEADTPDGTNFLSVVSRRWEAVFSAAITPVTRKVQLRIGSVLLSKGGMLSPFVKLVRLGLGGTIGSGTQYLSWIHERDFARLVDWTISNDGINGIVHASAPNPVNNQDFMVALRKRLGISFGLRNYEWSTKLGAWLIGTEPALALSGHRVVSSMLHDRGFAFDFPELPSALDNLVL